MYYRVAPPPDVQPPTVDKNKGCTHLRQAHGLKQERVHQRVRRPPRSPAEGLRKVGDEEFDGGDCDRVVALVENVKLRLSGNNKFGV